MARSRDGPKSELDDAPVVASLDDVGTVPLGGDRVAQRLHAEVRVQLGFQFFERQVGLLGDSVADLLFDGAPLGGSVARRGGRDLSAFAALLLDAPDPGIGHLKPESDNLRASAGVTGGEDIAAKLLRIRLHRRTSLSMMFASLLILRRGR